MSRGARLILALSAAWWAGQLLAGAGTRAFDLSDPAQQLQAAERSAAALAAAGPRAWMGSVVAGSLGKPAQNAALSQALAAGLPVEPRSYHLVTGLFTLAALLALQWCVLRAFGTPAGAVFAVLCAASQALLAEAFHGGHTWFGQAFLWTALAFELREGKGRAHDLCVGLLCGLAALSSHHVAPLAAALAARRVWVTRGRALPHLALGAFGPLLAFELLGAGLGRPRYWEVFIRMLVLATEAKSQDLASIHGFVPRWLFGAEGKIFGSLVVALAASAAYARPRLALGLLALLAFYELPWALRIGRVQLPLLLALLAAAAAGAGDLLSRAKLSQRTVLALIPVAALALMMRSRDTRAAFHFRGPAATVGVSVPFSYGESARGTKCAAVATLPPATPVLVSRWSGWFWRGFLPRERFDIPVETLYASDLHVAEVPGVESHPYFLYSNDAFLYRVLHGELSFPVSNRVYPASVVSQACRREGI